jgi:hypothetical protein
MPTMTITKSLMPVVERSPIWRTRLGMWLKDKLGIGRRWGVRFNRGHGEKMGFYFRREATRWARRAEHVKDYVVFHYEPLGRQLASTRPEKEQPV